MRLGEKEHAEQALAELGEEDRDRGEVRIATAVLRLAQGDPGAAAAVLASVLAGSAAMVAETWLVHAFLLEAIARDAPGDPTVGEHALERALDVAEPDGVLFPFLLFPVRNSPGPSRAPRPRSGVTQEIPS